LQGDVFWDPEFKNKLVSTSMLLLPALLREPPSTHPGRSKILWEVVLESIGAKNNNKFFFALPPVLSRESPEPTQIELKFCKSMYFRLLQEWKTKLRIYYNFNATVKIIPLFQNRKLKKSLKLQNKQF